MTALQKKSKEGWEASKMQNEGGHCLRGSVQGLSFALQGKTGNRHTCVRTGSSGQDLHRSGVTQHQPSSSSARREICASCLMLRKPTVSAVWGWSMTLGEGLKSQTSMLLC